MFSAARDLLFPTGISEIRLNAVILMGVVVSTSLAVTSVLAEDPQSNIQTVSLSVAAPTPSEQTTPSTFSEILRLLLLESMKSEYVDLRHWKGTAKRFDGFHVRGARISKRERDVPHGIWRRYRVNLIRPEKTFEATVEQLEPDTSGNIPFSILVSLRARCEATFVWWTYGVKGLNGTAVSDATLHLKLQLVTNPKLNFRLDGRLPRVELQPRVTQVDLKLKDLDVRQIGILKGDLAEVLGDGSRKAVEALMQQQEGKIRDKLQKSLEEAVP